MDKRHSIAVFLTVAFGLPWLFWLLRLGTGIDILAPGAMVSVGIATLIAVRWIERPASIRVETGLTPQPRLSYLALGFAGTLGLAAAAVLIGAAAGVHHLDLDHFSGLRQVFGGGAASNTDVTVLMATALGQSLVLFVILLPLAFCEEWGWRGFLLPRLSRFGTWPALLSSGVIWGVWHLPGYLGPHARAGLVPFVIFCVLFGTLLGWLRLTSGSVWPSTIAHAANNTVVIGFFNVAATDAGQLAAPDPWSLGLSGWPGWIAMAAAICCLVATGRLRSASTTRSDSKVDADRISTAAEANWADHGIRAAREATRRRH
jgi:membrane protease YdiL (CAAX protease family)